MKTKSIYLLLLLCNLFCFYRSGAQSLKIGTTWFYNVPNGLYRAYAAKDTTIAGTPCIEILSEKRVDVRTPGITGLPTVYLQDKGDTVFAYNNLFGKFTPLYIFNVSDGDTLTLPAFRYHPCQDFPGSLPDSNFRFVMDSVRMVRWDTSLLKTVYGHGLRSTGTAGLSMDWGSYSQNRSVYVQHIGSIYSGLLPNCFNCVTITDGACRWIDSLLCYSDDTRSVKLVSGECDKGLPPLSLKPDPGLSAAINIYPNPAEDYILVTLNTGLKGSISIFDVLGKEVIRRELEPGGSTRIDISSLSRGTYIARIVTADGNSWFGTWNKR
jgi:hypothetical protein